VLLEIAQGFVFIFGYIDPLGVVLGVPDDRRSVTTVGKTLYELIMVLIIISATIERQLWGKTGTEIFGSTEEFLVEGEDGENLKGHLRVSQTGEITIVIVDSEQRLLRTPTERHLLGLIGEWISRESR
jgi:hypothetical protein